MLAAIDHDASPLSAASRFKSGLSPFSSDDGPPAGSLVTTIDMASGGRGWKQKPGKTMMCIYIYICIYLSRGISDIYIYTYIYIRGCVAYLTKISFSMLTFEEFRAYIYIYTHISLPMNLLTALFLARLGEYFRSIRL